MTNFTRLLMLSLSFTVIPGCEGEAKPDYGDSFVAEEKEYVLVWADEFDGDGSGEAVLPDKKNWTANNRGGVINNELQDYRTDDIRCTRVEDGKLILEAFIDPHDGETGWSDSQPYHFEYSSGEVHTTGKVNFEYGRIDIMAKIPSGKGLWPAFWLRPENAVDGKYSEIDIMEHVWSLGDNHNTVQATVHTQDTRDKGEGYTPVQSGYVSSETLSTEFHLYSLVWEEDKLSVMFDNQTFFTYERPVGYDWDDWPFRQPHYLILNIAVGGNWGGDVDNSIFDTPQTMEIDYIRYYKMEE